MFLNLRKQNVKKKTGIKTKNSKELTERIDYLLSNEKVRNKIGKAAKESVRKHFLMPRLVLDHMRVYNKLIRTA